jgi:putative ABC transport system permease protein
MSENRKIIGVIKDFHTGSLHMPIVPLMITADPDFFIPHRMLFVRLQTTDVVSTVEKIQHAWKQLAPEYPLTLSFLDDQYQALYQSEIRLRNVIFLFSVLAVCIGCLGLFGLTVFTTEQRTKEIGIRKVLGASVLSIISLLSKDFLKLILIASLIALPVAWMAMHKWLEDFAYHIQIGWWLLTGPVILLMVIAISTTCLQTWKAAQANPAKVLRNE